MVDGIPTADVASTDESAQLSDAEIWDELDSGSSPNEDQTDATDGANATQEDDPDSEIAEGSPDNPSQGEDATTKTEQEDDSDDAIAKALAEDLAEDEDEETGEGDDQETHDDLTVAKKQVEDAKKRMHQATMEASDLRKANEEKEQRLLALEERLNTMQTAIDSGEAKTSTQARLDAVMGNLTEAQKEAFELYPEIMDVVLAITDGKKSGPQSEKMLSGKGDDRKDEQDSQTGNQSEDQVRIQAQKWQEAVTEMDPQFLELIETPEWKEYTKACKRTVSAVMDTYENWDPRGAKQLYRGFNAWKAKGANPSPKTVKTPRSGSVSSQRRGAPVKTREQEESEIWDEVTGG